MKKNVKIIASLVRKSKKKLIQGKRDEALDLMRKAVEIDDNNGVLVQVIKVIGKKKLKTDYREETVPETEPEPEPEMTPEPEPEPAADMNHERTSSMASEDRLFKLFEASDMEYENGHQQKAVAYLKKARQLAPDDPEVQSRIDLLRARIKSANLVQIARKKFESGETVKALVLAREAFDILPLATGLDRLLEDLEEGSGTHEAPAEPEPIPQKPAGSAVDSAGEYISRIRQLVQDNSLEKAAELAEKAHGIHPDDALLSEFMDNFKKLGLLD
ncbi:MAG: hypothetical protein R6U39_08075 [Candidatus Aegiribacteria sp.]